MIFVSVFPYLNGFQASGLVWRHELRYYYCAERIFAPLLLITSLRRWAEVGSVTGEVAHRLDRLMDPGLGLLSKFESPAAAVTL